MSSLYNSRSPSTVYPFHYTYGHLFVYGVELSDEINIPSCMHAWYGFFQVIDTSALLMVGPTTMGRYSPLQVFADFGKHANIKIITNNHE
jgi:hypothetical protein